MFGIVVWRSLRGTRSLVALVAVVVPAALVTGAANFVLDADAKMNREVRAFGVNLVVTLEGVPDPDALNAALSPGARTVWVAEGVREVEIGGGVIEAPVVIVSRLDEAVALMHNLRFEGRVKHPADDTRTAYVGQRLADRGRARPGEAVRIGEETRTIVGTVALDDPWDRSIVTGPLGTPVWNRVLASVDPSEADAVAARINREVEGAQARPVRAIAATEARLVERLRGLFGLVALLILAASALGISMTLTASVVEKRREIGLMKALGASEGTVLRVLAAQLTILLLAGLALGSAAGFGLSDFMGRRVFGTGTEIRPAALAISAGSCLVMAAFAAVWPARRAARVEPALVLKEE